MRYLLLVVMFLMPSVVHAGLANDFQYAWTEVGTYSSEAVQWVKYAGKRALEAIGQEVPAQTPAQEQRAAQVLASLSSGDQAYLQNNKIPLYLTQTAENQDAAFFAMQNAVAVGEHAMSKYSMPVISTLVHHEIQHARDYKSLNEAGYSLTSLDAGVTAGGNVLDMVSKSILSSVLEARAYSEHVVFSYQQILAHPNDPAYQAAYDDLLSKNEFMLTFDNAIKEGKSIEEARHLLNTAILNDENLQKIYLEQDMQGTFHDLVSLSVDEILRILGDGKLTREDLFKADGFWQKLCSSEKARDSQACQEYREYRGRGSEDGKPCDCAAYYGGLQFAADRMMKAKYPEYKHTKLSEGGEVELSEADFFEQAALFCSVTDKPFQMMTSRDAPTQCKVPNASVCCPEGAKAVVACPWGQEEKEKMEVICLEPYGTYHYTTNTGVFSRGYTMESSPLQQPLGWVPVKQRVSKNAAPPLSPAEVEAKIEQLKQAALAAQAQLPSEEEQKAQDAVMMQAQANYKGPVDPMAAMKEAGFTPEMIEAMQRGEAPQVAGEKTEAGMSPSEQEQAITQEAIAAMKAAGMSPEAIEAMLRATKENEALDPEMQKRVQEELMKNAGVTPEMIKTMGAQGSQ